MRRVTVAQALPWLLGRTAVSLLLAAALLSCGQFDPTNPRLPGAGSPSPTISLHPAPTPVDGDPILALPETATGGRLLVSTLSDERPLQVVDLTAGRTAYIGGIPGGGLQLGSFTPDGGVAFVAGPRSVGFLDPSGARRPAESELPESTPGTIRSLTVAGDAVVVSTGIGEPGRQTDGRTVVLELDGKVRCEGPAGGPLFTWYRAASMWTQDFRFRMDPATCVASAGLDLEGYEGPLFLLTEGSSGYLTVDGYSLSRFDLPTGAVVETSARRSQLISDAVLRDGDIWMLAGDELVRLDPVTLEEKSVRRLLECGYSPSFARHQQDLYVVDDCMGVLYRLDESASFAEGWELPLDEGSDLEIFGGKATAEGIWFVDPEQTGEPYFFNPNRSRFEQIPRKLKEGGRIFALEFDVYPMPSENG